MTDVLVSSPQSAAKQVTQDRYMLKLTAKDREVFVHALLKPAKPNAKLRRAVKRYKKLIG